VTYKLTVKSAISWQKSSQSARTSAHQMDEHPKQVGGEWKHAAAVPGNKIPSNFIFLLNIPHYR
jgi:hypothetical protein